MNSKKPIQNISPLQNDASGDAPHLRQLLDSFYQSIRTLAFGLIAFGILTIAGGVYCVFATDPRLHMTSLPLVGFGLGFSWLGYRALRTMQDARAVTPAPIDQGGMAKYLTLLERFSGLLSQLKNLSTILLGIGLCGVVLVCFVEAFTYSVGLWFALSVSAGLFTVTCLIIHYSVAIHLHEVSRNRQPD